MVFDVSSITNCGPVCLTERFLLTQHRVHALELLDTLIRQCLFCPLLKLRVGDQFYGGLRALQLKMGSGRSAQARGKEREKKKDGAMHRRREKLNEAGEHKIKQR